MSELDEAKAAAEEATKAAQDMQSALEQEQNANQGMREALEDVHAEHKLERYPII